MLGAQVEVLDVLVLLVVLFDRPHEVPGLLEAQLIGKFGSRF